MRKAAAATNLQWHRQVGMRRTSGPACACLVPWCVVPAMLADLSRRRCVRPAGHRAPRNWLLNSAGHGGPLLLVLSSKRSEHQVPPLPETQTPHQSHLLVTDRCSRTSGGGGPVAISLHPSPQILATRRSNQPTLHRLLLRMRYLLLIIRSGPSLSRVQTGWWR